MTDERESPPSELSSSSTGSWGLRRLHTFVTDELARISKKFKDNEARDLQSQFSVWGEKFAQQGYTVGQAASVIHDAYKEHCLLQGEKTSGDDGDWRYRLVVARLPDFESLPVKIMVASVAAVILGADKCSDFAFAEKLAELADQAPGPATDYFRRSDSDGDIAHPGSADFF